jgi:hypothetical protein
VAILIEEGEASEEVLAVYADIKATRKTDWVNSQSSRDLEAHVGEHQAGYGARSLGFADQGIGLHSGQRHEQLRLLHSVADLLYAWTRWQAHW